MRTRSSHWAAIPLGLVLGGLAGLVLGLATGDSNQWMILGAGGGLVLGLAVGTALDNRRRNQPKNES
jgi:hypothetical protein